MPTNNQFIEDQFENHDATSNHDSPADTFLDSNSNLANELMEKGYHPIMIFGTRASGKSTLLVSLFHFMQTNQEAGAICMFGDPIVPLSTPYGKGILHKASDFFYRAVEGYINKKQVLGRTSERDTFFIPIIIKPSNGMPEVRLAFLESAGEWYQVNENPNELYYKPLQNEIENVYRNYNGPISMILAAPYTTSAAFGDIEIDGPDSDEMKASDQGLKGALEAYQKYRPVELQNHDSCRFLLTKWDVVADNLISPDSKEFSNPPPQLLHQLIQERFPWSFAFFKNMPHGGENKKVMPYSAGFISGSEIIREPALNHIFIKFPKTMWNWFYKNATGGIDLYSGLNPNLKKRSLMDHLKGIFS